MSFILRFLKFNYLKVFTFLGIVFLTVYFIDTVSTLKAENSSLEAKVLQLQEHLTKQKKLYEISKRHTEKLKKIHNNYLNVKKTLNIPEGKANVSYKTQKEIIDFFNNVIFTNND